MTSNQRAALKLLARDYGSYLREDLSGNPMAEELGLEPKDLIVRFMNGRFVVKADGGISALPVPDEGGNDELEKK